MQDDAIGLIIFLLINISISIYFYRKTNSLYQYFLVSAVTTIIIFELVSAISNGFLSPFWMIEVLIGFFISLIISGGVHLIRKSINI